MGADFGQPLCGRITRLFFRVLLAGVFAFGLVACKKAISEKDFVGKWQSTRTNTPIHMGANGEWEIRAADGHVLQYGLWRFADQKLIWSVKQEGKLVDDPNPVLTMAPTEFSVQELNGSTTVFKRVP